MKRQGTFRKTLQYYFLTLLIGLIVWIATHIEFYSLTDGNGLGSLQNLPFALLICAGGLIFCSPLLIPISIYFHVLQRWKMTNSISFRCSLNVVFGALLSCSWAFLIDNSFKGIFELWPFIFGACAAGVIVEILSIDTSPVASKPIHT